MAIQNILKVKDGMTKHVLAKIGSIEIMITPM